MVTTATHRDASIDLLRAACTIVVVALHAMMAGIIAAGGEIALANALETTWFWPASWLLQIMPLFFLAGGVTAAVSYRRARAAGGSGAAFAAGRVQRLLPPGIVAIGITAVGLAALSLAGVPDDLVAEAGFRISQPLWFLGVFLLAQTLVPAMLAAHERRPVVTVGVLAAAALAVDITRASTGIEVIGFVNLAIVWLLIQQIGFFLADGRFAAVSTRFRLGLAGGALVVAGILAAAGFFSPDMYVNLNPPTMALALLGLAQACIFSVLQPTLRRVAAKRTVAAAIAFIGRRAMTIYLWHMPAIVALAGILLAAALTTGTDLPALYSPAWWATRPAWFAVVALVTLGLTSVAPVLRTAAVARRVTRARAIGASVLGVASVAILFVAGFDVGSAVISVAIGALALTLIRGRRETRGITPAEVVGQPHAAVAA